LAEVADDRRWVLGQLLEDGSPELRDRGQIEPPGQGQDHASLAMRLLDPHRGLPSAVSSDKHPILELALPNASTLDGRRDGKLTGLDVVEVSTM
jgi:hypothetical protein